MWNNFHYVAGRTDPGYIDMKRSRLTLPILAKTFPKINISVKGYLRQGLCYLRGYFVRLVPVISVVYESYTFQVTSSQSLFNDLCSHVIRVHNMYVPMYFESERFRSFINNTC